MRRHLSLPAIFAALGILLVAPEIAGIERAFADSSFTRRAMDDQQFEPTENARTLFRYILFSTNRKIDRDEEFIARTRSGAVLRYDKLFRPSPVAAISYGWAKVSIPAHHRPGGQDYDGDSARQNPLQHFSIIDHKIFDTPDEFRATTKRLRGDESESDRSLIYVPGIDNSFNDGAERLAQLVRDLDISGIPVLFSWPSDNLRLFPTKSIIGLSETSYLETVRIALESTSYLMQTIDELSSATVPFDLLAHSMGSDILVNALTLRPSSGASSMAPGRLASVASMPSLVLAAPDVSTREFAAELRPKLMQRSKHITVYCSDDHALWLSAKVRRSDERLGFCAAPKQPMEGVEFVLVTGVAQDFANHSYYIISRDILNDVKRALSSDTSPQGLFGDLPARSIEIHAR